MKKNNNINHILNKNLIDEVNNRFDLYLWSAEELKIKAKNLRSLYRERGHKSYF